MLKNLGDEMLEGTTARAELGTKQGCRQSGGCEAQSLGKGSWQQRRTVVPMDQDNTEWYLHIRAGDLHPPKCFGPQQCREAQSQLRAFLFGGIGVKPIFHSV